LARKNAREIYWAYAQQMHQEEKVLYPERTIRERKFLTQAGNGAKKQPGKLCPEQKISNLFEIAKKLKMRSEKRL